MSSGKRIAAKAKRVAPKVIAQRIAKTDRTTRVRGHVSARGRRAQARQDQR